MTNEKMKKRVMELLLVLAGNVLMSIGVGAFVIPEELMSGGATGLGLLAAHYFHIPVAVFLGGYNAIMFVVGALTLGKHFAVTTLISSFLFPFLLSQIQLVVTEPLTADPMLATVLGGLLIGAGIGLVIRAGSSTGGNDVPVLLLKKKLGIPLSVSMYGFDIVILLFQIPYSQLEKALYSIILIILYSMIADKPPPWERAGCRYGSSARTTRRSPMPSRPRSTAASPCTTSPEAIRERNPARS